MHEPCRQTIGSVLGAAQPSTAQLYEAVVFSASLTYANQGLVPAGAAEPCGLISPTPDVLRPQVSAERRRHPLAACSVTIRRGTAPHALKRLELGIATVRGIRSLSAHNRRWRRSAARRNTKGTEAINSI